MNDFENKKDNTLCLKNREQLSIEGVTDVDAFNEQEISAKTDYGSLLIKGDGLHIEEFDLSCGILKVKGRVYALVYSNEVSKKSTLKRLFS